MDFIDIDETYLDISTGIGSFQQKISGNFEDTLDGIKKAVIIIEN